MKNIYFVISVALICGLLFPACKASYPKENLTRSVEQLIKKEYNLEGRAKLTGDTLYLEVNLEGLISTEQKVLTEILKKVQGASLVITRVALSSDAKIKFMVLIASEPSFKLHLRIIQKLDDIKAYLYQKISRADYEDRLVLEIERGTDADNAAENDVESDRDISMKEFVGRLIVSQVNMLSRSNPFLGVTLGNPQLKYIDFKEDELIVGISKNVSSPVMPFFEDIVNTQSLKIGKKYIGWGPKKIRLTDNTTQAILIDVAPKTAKIKN